MSPAAQLDSGAVPSATSTMPTRSSTVTGPLAPQSPAHRTCACAGENEIRHQAAVTNNNERVLDIFERYLCSTLASTRLSPWRFRTAVWRLRTVGLLSLAGGHFALPAS